MRIVDSKPDVELTLDNRTRRIRDCFERGASSYDRFADVQASVAQELAATIARRRRVDEIDMALEIGCGTGFLTEHLLRQYSEAGWSITDLSPAMLNCCRSKLCEDQELSLLNRSIDFQIEDGQHPTLAGPFDLICSNLTFQWFSDLGCSVGKWANRLTDGGCLAFSLMGAGSFSVWIDEYADDPRAPVPSSFPSVDELHKRLGLELGSSSNRGVGPFDFEIIESQAMVAYPSLRDFFLALKGIGANGSLGDSRPCFGEIKDWLKGLEKKPVTINYNVLTVLVDRIGFTLA